MHTDVQQTVSQVALIASDNSAVQLKTGNAIRLCVAILLVFMELHVGISWRIALSIILESKSVDNSID